IPELLAMQIPRDLCDFRALLAYLDCGRPGFVRAVVLFSPGEELVGPPGWPFYFDPRETNGKERWSGRRTRLGPADSEILRRLLRKAMYRWVWRARFMAMVMPVLFAIPRWGCLISSLCRCTDLPAYSLALA